MPSPWDFLTSINQTKKDLMESGLIEDEKSYNAFIINRGLSYFPDTALYANEMNRLHNLDNKLQYDFLRTIIRPRKRFSKWDKRVEPDNLQIVKDYFGYNNQRALEALSILTKEQLESIKKSQFKGGRQGKTKNN